MRSRIIGVVVLAAIGVACSTNQLERAIGVDRASIECESFATNRTIDADFDAELKAFMSASVDLERISVDIDGSVKTACANIARDLGSADESCAGASARITAIMEAHANANFSLQYSRGGCHTDYEEVKKCDQQCKDVETCEPGTVEERCTPGEVSVVCSGKCKAQATCRGTFELAANCQGKCEAECRGKCTGTCTGRDGKTTENNEACEGKCTGSCEGTCSGSCQIEASAGIECGASVRCKGGCETQYTEPVCETHCNPPKCTVKKSCWESCSSQVEAKTVCEPTRVTLYADVNVHADVQLLVNTVNANLGILVDAAEVRGKLVVGACERLLATGQGVARSINSINVKETSCATVAVKATADAVASLQGSVQGSASVVTACSSHAK